MLGFDRQRGMAVWCAAALSLSVPAGAQTAGKAATRPAQPTKAAPGQASDQLGDIHFAKYDSLAGNPDTGFRLLGRNTEVDIPDVTSHAKIHLHADDIFLTDYKNQTFQTVELKGSVEYNVVQKTSEGGTRTVHGTSAHGILHRLRHEIDQDGNVRLILHDDAHFIGPAELHAERVVANIEAAPYRYSLNGSADTNDIKFTPRDQVRTTAKRAGAAPVPGQIGMPSTTSAAPDVVQAARLPTISMAPGQPAKPPRTPSTTPQVGAVHVYHFLTGEFVPGKSLLLRGPGTTLDVSGSTDASTAQLQGSEVECAFTADGSALERATATGDVRYSALRPEVPDKVSRLAIHGTAQSASLLNLEAGRQIVLHGPYLVSVEDPRMSAPLTETGADAEDKFSVTEGPNGWNNFLAIHPSKAGVSVIPPAVQQTKSGDPGAASGTKTK